MFETLKAIDRYLLLEINSMHNPYFDLVMWHLSLSWHTVVFVIAAGFMMYMPFSWQRTLKFLLTALVLFAFTDFLSNSVKHGIERYRPTHNLEIGPRVRTVNGYMGGKFGFFSGHASNSFAVTSLIIFCMKRLNILIRLLMLIYPLSIGYSRVYLGVHYPSDVITGAIFGILSAFGFYYFINKYLFRLENRTA